MRDSLRGDESLCVEGEIRGSPAGRLLLLIVGLIATGIYWPALGAGFVWDDQHYIARPECLLSCPPWQGFTDNRWQPGAGRWAYYRPVAYASHWLDARLFGLDPAGHHFTNIILHAWLVALLASVALRLGASPLAAAIASAYFAFLPAHADDVAWVSGRQDLLAALLGLGSVRVLLGDHHPIGRRRILGASALLWGALCSKESALAFVAAGGLLLLVLPPASPARRSTDAPWPTRSDLLLWLLPALALYFAGRRLHPDIRPGNPMGWPANPAEVAFAMILNVRLAGLYLAALAGLTDLGPALGTQQMILLRESARGLWGVTIGCMDAGLLAALIALAAIGCGALPLARTRTGLLGLALLAGGLASTLNTNPVHIQILFAERYVLVSSAGVALLLAAWVDRPTPPSGTLARWSSTRRALVVLAMAIAGGVCVRSIHTRIERYRDDRAFWSAAVQLDPLSFVARTNLGRELWRRGDLDLARRHLAVAFWLLPSEEALADLVHIDLDRNAPCQALGWARAYPRLAAGRPIVVLRIKAHLAAGEIPEALALLRDSTVDAPPSAELIALERQCRRAPPMTGSACPPRPPRPPRPSPPPRSPASGARVRESPGP